MLIKRKRKQCEEIEGYPTIYLIKNDGSGNNIMNMKQHLKWTH